MQIEDKEAALMAFLQEKGKIAIAFSGGTDSAYLLYAAAKSGAEVKAYTVKSAFQPAFETADAKRLADGLYVASEVIPVDILQDESIAENPANRCYHCKKRLFRAILEHAVQDGFAFLCDGTNASDDAKDRPGMAALRELEVLSPLQSVGLTKSEVRELSKRAGLFTWDKPAYACLATRIPTGTVITREDLARTEHAEDYLSGLGFRDFRVRLAGEAAKLQIPADGFELLVRKRREILSELKQYYKEVLVDLEERG